jgi:hypothetical protein
MNEGCDASKPTINKRCGLGHALLNINKNKPGHLQAFHLPNYPEFGII